jgi:integrase
MTNSKVSLSAANPAMLAGINVRIAADQSLTFRKRQDVCSAYRMTAKAVAHMDKAEQNPSAIKLTLENIPADPAWIRNRLKGFAPAMLRMSAKRWSNVQSLARFGFEHLGINRIRSAQPIAPVWEDLLGRVPKEAKALRIGLLSSARFWSAGGVAPEDVTQATFDAFRDYLLFTRLSRNPRETHRMACKLWNQASDAYDWWPRVKATVPDYRNTYIVPWETFPPALKQKIDGYIDHLSGKDRFATRNFKPLRPASLASKAVHLHEYCSALKHAGYDVRKLKSLKDLVTEPALRAGLTYFLEVRKAERHAHGVAVMLLIMAKHYLKSPPKVLENLQSAAKNLNTVRPGMTEKNKLRMRQFDDPNVVRRLLELPRDLRRQAAKIEAPCKKALKIQTALLVELLLMMPVRLTNLSHLEVGKHVVRIRKGVVRIVIPADEVKNGQPYDAILLQEPSALVEEYIDKYLPVLQREKASTWLFPGYKGPKNHSSLRKQIMNAIRHGCGAVLNPHAFRHLAAKLILDEEPGAYGKVRLVLNHTSTATTQRAYAGAENAAALRHYDQTVINRRTPFMPSRLRTSTKGL